MTTIAKSDVMKARAELDRMRRSLASWLKFRTMNDAVMAGTLASRRLPGTAARKLVAANLGERAQTEQTLADQLHALLSELHPDAAIPNPNVAQNPNAAVDLAKLVIAGPASLPMARPQPQGFIWMWPVLIVGGLLLAVTTAIRSMADVAKEKERLACIRAGACTDYGFWLKLGGVAMAGWFAWTQTGLGPAVKGAISKRVR